uniref:Putative acetyltransferase n=1 Tax=Candidatus Kentrum sp. SD TaxID=2126332 RepID=A0A450Z633_9GAMM|nr:MAG: putative acetyltransferase [Candidatus Kentron sp. SD]VFK49229.1 MAG: putative acetyltransferase [Candidatus Kentron sp. SD]
MESRIFIKSETKSDIDAITEVTVAAFKTLEISNNTEQFIIMALRAAEALAVSLVAKLDGRVIGHLALSPVTISDGASGWYGLGPVSVLPAHQRQGVGAALIREGLFRLKNLMYRKNKNSEGLSKQGNRLSNEGDYYQQRKTEAGN